MGFVTGTIGGLGAGVQYSLDNKVNLFTGKPNPVMQKPNQLALPAHVEYPPGDGSIGDTKEKYLMKGDFIERHGDTNGYYASPEGTPMEMKSLPPNNTGEYNLYKVVKPFPVQTGTVAPWFGQPGMGIQYQLPVRINILLNKGFIIPF